MTITNYDLNKVNLWDRYWEPVENSWRSGPIWIYEQDGKVVASIEGCTTLTSAPKDTPFDALQDLLGPPIVVWGKPHYPQGPKGQDEQVYESDSLSGFGFLAKTQNGWVVGSGPLCKTPEAAYQHCLQNLLTYSQRAVSQAQEAHQAFLKTLPAEFVAE